YLVNGRPADAVSILDRGLHYGDGVFETIAIRDGQPCYWDQHQERLLDGCARLGISFSDTNALAQDCRLLCPGVSKAVLKIIVTRGTGGLGYNPALEQPVTRITGLLPWPDYPAHYATEGIAVCLCETRLGANPALAGIKHLNRLEQILASREWQNTEYAEGLMMDRQDHLVEGSRSNLFVVKKNRLYTPDLVQCGVAGIMRAVVLEQASRLQLPIEVTTIDRDSLFSADEIFVTNSLIGIWPVHKVEQNHYSVGPVTLQLKKSLQLCPEEHRG
ncbi:MAG: aminodeoxychorismate lyase, partial [Gammaproteobacteria bacterium]